MREKTLKVVMTFGSTADALAMEGAAREHGLPGRIIPVPSEVDAGCGLAWCADVSDRTELLSQTESHGLAYEDVFEIPMY
ncbi:MAG: DUF3343 domain-containing protein [Coriobacteriaceae bacterium]|jgi:hypothetical protein|nr:DUF3343 domain-containing protein [Coriobacteriaceae bacterium]